MAVAGSRSTGASGQLSIRSLGLPGFIPEQHAGLKGRDQMTQHYHSFEFGGTPTGVPPQFMRVSDGLPAWAEYRLGYTGDARFVAFRYDPAIGSVIWEDGRERGPAAGAAFTAIDQIIPWAALGRIGPLSRGVLVVDRRERIVYVVQQEHAARFLARQGNGEL